MFLARRTYALRNTHTNCAEDPQRLETPQLPRLRAARVCLRYAVTHGNTNARQAIGRRCDLDLMIPRRACRNSCGEQKQHAKGRVATAEVVRCAFALSAKRTRHLRLHTRRRRRSSRQRNAQITRRRSLRSPRRAARPRRRARLRRSRTRSRPASSARRCGCHRPGSGSTGRHR
jgi:hypothetical protein